MGFYSTQIVPRFVNKVLATGEFMKFRGQTCEGLRGTVVEIGFGSGLNIEKYPDAVTHVYAVDPSLVGRKLAAERVDASPVRIEYVGLDGQSLPLDDESCDAALSTFTLCTIPDAEQALTEVMRVLKPGAALHTLEHGLSRDDKIAKKQYRYEPLQKRLADGCHLTRDHDALLRAAGFEIELIHEFRPRKGIKALSELYRAVARKPAA